MIKINAFKLTVIAGAAFVSLQAAAEEKLWTLSTGLNYRDTSFNQPNNKFDNESWITNLGLMRKLDSRTYLGGNIAYSNDTLKFKSFSGETEIDTPSVSAYIMRELAWGLYADGSIGYGKSQIDTNIANLNYNADSRFRTATVGLTQYIPISQNLMSNISAHYSHISSDRDRFITSLGNAVPSDGNTLSYLSLAGQLTWQLNKWSPYMRLNWNKANREFMTGTGDKDFFGYGFGARYAISTTTNIGLNLGSVFDKRNTNETNAGISLNYQF